jgi:hypothetical protein
MAVVAHIKRTIIQRLFLGESAVSLWETDGMEEADLHVTIVDGPKRGVTGGS